MKRARFLPCLAFIGLVAQLSALGTDAPPPVITNLVVSGSQQGLRFPLYPGAQAYTILSGTNLSFPLTPDPYFFQAPYIVSANTNGTNYSYEWRRTNNGSPSGFYRVQVTPLNSNAVLTATVLNRLAYGPTPDEVERVTAMGPQAFIDEQLNMDGLPETIDTYTVQATNGVPNDPATNWTLISVTGKLSGTNLYLFTTAPGDIYVDDIELRALYYSNYVTTNISGSTTNYVTNTVTLPPGPNLLVNGDFESTLTPPWNVTGAASNSIVATNISHGGGGSLHLVTAAAGSTSSGNVWQPVVSGLTNNAPVVLNYWYLPNPNSSLARVQLNGSGLITSPGSTPPTPQWIYAKATGVATTTSQLYIYLSGSGEAYLDDIKLVAGTNAEVGANLLQNGDFESPLTYTAGNWQSNPNFTNSSISSSFSHSGGGSLHLLATAGGSGNGNSFYQTVTPALVAGQTYTLSYWFLPATFPRTLTVRLSGSLLNSVPDVDVPGLYRRLQNVDTALSDYRAWFCMHAVTAKRQLFEIMSQFWENHFVTQYTKSVNYLGGFSYDGNTQGRLATDWEFREMTKWRNAMLNPQCTFYDMLKISAESPAMIVYLDSVNSTGNGNNVANENYAREVMELFTMGVDNGYDQTDITVQSRAWTGWSVDIVDPANVNNPLAPISVTYYPDGNGTSKSNTVGVWAFNFKSGNHGTNRAPIFAGKTVPARFGAPWAGQSYQLNLPARTGTNGIQDGYDVITRLANLPFTEEYISIKLCRLFVHDDFPNPSNDPSNPIYNFYNYAAGNLSPEADLVHQCMLAWENGNPKGQIRSVLATIFNSDLFRSHTGAAQKVKTPLEYVASSVRALRSVNSDGSATANTDGYSFATPLSRMGGMNLFDRDAPDGYAESGASWISAGTLTERIRYVQAMCIASGGSGRSDAGNHTNDPVTLLKKKLPSTSWNNAGNVADYFLGILYPGEGQGNLALYRTAAVNFLNVADDGVTSSPFVNLGNTTSTYDTRVRGMAAMLMTFQRFHEQ
jgi:uncharacterized protein (DUF1800 family)